MSVNKAILVGRLGKDIEVRTTGTGKAVAELRLATDHTWTDGQGQRQAKTEWHSVSVWGKTAENCAKFLKKGSQVYVEGRIETQEWTDKEGIKRYKVVIQGDNVTFLGGKGETGDVADANAYRGPAAGSPDDDLPF
jgi:single-strand DNA-binding protein